MRTLPTYDKLRSDSCSTRQKISRINIYMKQVCLEIYWDHNNEIIIY